MRFGIDVDDDLAERLKQRSRELGMPYKEVVNRTIRAGLGETAKLSRSAVPKTRRGPIAKTIPHSFGFRPDIDLDKLGQLADGLSESPQES